MNSVTRHIVLLDDPTFAPTSIANLALWLDAADASSITLDGSNNVSEWRDKSTNLRHAGQEEPSLRPAYSLAAVNGKNTVTFDGTGTRLLTASLSIAQPMTVLVVFLQSTSTGFQITIDSAAPRISMFSSSANTLWYHAGTNQSVAQAVALDTPHLLTGIFNGASSSLRFNGTTISSADPGSNSAGGAFCCGATSAGAFPLTGKLCEVMLYSAVVSEDDLLALKAYAATKWGIS